ncbi:ADP-ribosylglycohydrolase family protein [Amycolatopsis sp. OK19-0408]|uniref:ADP-ribosylglycohydrolase family protein n=1 Tax=Amycolatopsis iheyensis TaxID=2945988 RepID=A0A9X2SQA3_9PSEU|nr:ADP-ribosylglycohydrolase family protein [Amycolatopsis iheyensis]MCR6489131.1 ADP-ribosylglycohydrolase family protein [Amycolatopsis iheyensis]
MRLTWAQPEDLLPHELVQSAAEGKDVTAVRERWVAAGGSPIPAVGGAGPAMPELRSLARELLDELDSPVDEPEPVLPAAPVLPRGSRGRELAAWTGRAAGCLLGKPVEKIPREGIEEILRATGRWPLDRWFTAVGLPADVAERWPWNRRSAPTSLEENIDGMPEDDDLNYPMLALSLVEAHGRSFTTSDVAQLWLDNLPAGRVFTAERAAYRNLLDARADTATHHNPFREWIGALIRADVFGWVSPGDVHEAARLARVDARLSHTRNGVYGAMWAAALASAAMVCDTVDEVLDAASSVIPASSDLAAAVSFGRSAAADGDVRSGLDRVHAQYGHLHWVHVLNNAATIAYALAKGGGEFGPSVSIAVTAGWDTDSVAATVGGVAGAVSGVDEYWSKPLDGRIATSLPGGERRIEDLAARTAALA